MLKRQWATAAGLYTGAKLSSVAALISALVYSFCIITEVTIDGMAVEGVCPIGKLLEMHGWKGGIYPTCLQRVIVVGMIR